MKALIHRTGAILALLILVFATAVAPAGAQSETGSDDRVVMSGGLTVAEGETVAGNVVVLDGAVAVDGRVDGDVVAFAGPVRVGGDVGGSVTGFSQRVTLDPGARVSGDVLYGGERPQISPDATVGGKVSDEGWAQLSEPAPFIGRLALWLAVSVSTLLLGVALLGFAPRAADAAFAGARRQTGPAIAAGLAIVVGLPLVAAIALVTLVGIPLGVALLLALVPLYALGYTTAAWLLGRALLTAGGGRFVSFLAGLALLRGVAIIPILGGLVSVAAAAFGLGVLIVSAWAARAGRHGAEPATSLSAPAEPRLAL